MHRALAASLIAIALAPFALGAQDSTRAAASTLCTWDSCALRVEDGRILRGVQGIPVGRLGFLGATHLSPLVAPTDSARYYAGVFDRNYASGSRMSLLGQVGAGLCLLFVLDRSGRTDGNADQWRNEDWALLGGLVASMGVSQYGVTKIGRANRALSRAMWWSNRELARTR